MKKRIAVCTFVLAAGAVWAEPEIKGTPAELAAYLSAMPKLVNLSGDAEVKVQADRAYVKVKVTTEGRSLQEALGKNAALRQQITDELKKNGVPEESIAGSKFASQPEYGIFSDKAKSYRIENTLRVTVADESQFRVVAGSIDAHAEASFDGVDFEDSREIENKQAAEAQACDAVTKKRRLYEEKLGVKLATRGFSDTQVFASSPYPVQEMKYSAVSSAGMTTRGLVAAAPAGASQFGLIVYRAIMTVQYELTQE